LIQNHEPDEVNTTILYHEGETALAYCVPPLRTAFRPILAMRTAIIWLRLLRTV